MGLLDELGWDVACWECVKKGVRGNPFGDLVVMRVFDVRVV